MPMLSCLCEKPRSGNEAISFLPRRIASLAMAPSPLVGEGWGEGAINAATCLRAWTRTGRQITHTKLYSFAQQ